MEKVVKGEGGGGERSKISFGRIVGGEGFRGKRENNSNCQHLLQR